MPWNFVTSTSSPTNIRPPHAFGPEEGDQGVQHGEADVLTAARAFPGEQRRGHGLGGGQGGHLVGDDHAEHLRAPGFPVGLDVRRPGERLDYRVVNPLVGVGALLPESADRQVDEPGMGFEQLGGVEAKARHGTGPEVLHDHIRGSDQRTRRFQALRALDVQAQRTLAPVAGEESRRKPVARPPHIPNLIAPGGFDLDHLGALVGQDRPRHGTRQHGREVHHPHAVQRAGHQRRHPVESQSRSIIVSTPDHGPRIERPAETALEPAGGA